MQHPHQRFRLIPRVSVTADVLGADGRLRVQKGALGTIVSNDRGHLGVLFDDGPEYVELSGCGQRLQDVPQSSTKDEGLFCRHIGLFFRVMATFSDTEEGTREANAYMEANPGASLLGIWDKQAVIAHFDDMGVETLFRH